LLFSCELMILLGRNLMLVPLLIRDLVFRKAVVPASIGGIGLKTQYHFLEAALVPKYKGNTKP